MRLRTPESCSIGSISIESNSPGDTSIGSIRQACHGDVPLNARLQDWMVHCMRAGDLSGKLERFGSPLHIIHPESMASNIRAIREAAQSHAIPIRVQYAAKANKCVAFFKQAKQSRIGLDIASEQELNLALRQGMSGEDLICTAAVKDQTLTIACLRHNVLMVADHEDDLNRMSSLASEGDWDARVALRLSGFQHNQNKLSSRFGFDVSEAIHVGLMCRHRGIEISGLHFHLDGFDPGERVSALRETLAIHDILEQQGHPLAFIDMGGGFPVNYLEKESHWRSFLEQHRLALRGKRLPITHENHGLGLIAVDGNIHGRLDCYPAFQPLDARRWFTSILESFRSDESLAEALRRRSLELRCQPGRGLLDGCGITVARVESRKRSVNGDHFIGLNMNHTQCGTLSQEFLLDPILLKVESHEAGECESVQGYFVGTYCTESELLMRRRFTFPEGVSIGDLVVYPNTAAYQMHFKESRSHQMPQAKNLVYDHQFLTRPRLDLIDLVERGS